MAAVAEFHVTVGFAVTDPHQSQESDGFIFKQIKHLLLTEHISASAGQQAVTVGKRQWENPRKVVVELDWLRNML